MQNWPDSPFKGKKFSKAWKQAGLAVVDRTPLNGTNISISDQPGQGRMISGTPGTSGNGLGSDPWFCRMRHQGESESDGYQVCVNYFSWVFRSIMQSRYYTVLGLNHWLDVKSTEDGDVIWLDFTFELNVVAEIRVKTFKENPTDWNNFDIPVEFESGAQTKGRIMLAHVYRDPTPDIENPRLILRQLCKHNFWLKDFCAGYPAKYPIMTNGAYPLNSDFTQLIDPGLPDNE